MDRFALLCLLQGIVKGKANLRVIQGSHYYDKLPYSNMYSVCNFAGY